ncbi:MAG: TRAP transporter small permease [Rhodospirillales bacterium]
MTYQPTTRLGAIIDRIEVNGIAIMLGLMTVVTFANVIARYIFNSNILWALETTVFLFAWLVLLGMSHGVKISAHIGVDLILNMVGQSTRKTLVVISVICCLIFSVLLTIGSFEYWWPFATDRAWYEVNDIPMVFFPDLMADWLNEGEAYEKMPRFIPYAALPIGLVLLTLRFAQALWEVINDRRAMLIAGHEAEDMVEEGIR